MRGPQTKEALIRRFKFFCEQNDFREDREASVKYQFQRTVWEFDHYLTGKIRIELGFKNAKITLFHVLDVRKREFNVDSFEISNDEYEELKKMYFGNFQEDTEYLKNLNNTLLLPPK